MTRKGYYKTVWKIVYREFQWKLWNFCFCWLESHQPKQPPILPRKPTCNELELEASGEDVDYTGFYTYHEMVDRSLPNFKQSKG